MAWSNSKVFRAFLADSIAGTALFDINSHTIKVVLYDNDITPDNDVTSANTAYNVGQWVSTGNEVFQAGTWAQGGVNLGSPTVDSSIADTVFFSGSNAASGSGATLSNAWGVLLYDDTLTTPVANQGICYNYLGGANSVTNGVLTIVWHANGIFRASL